MLPGVYKYVNLNLCGFFLYYYVVFLFIPINRTVLKATLSDINIVISTFFGVF